MESWTLGSEGGREIVPEKTAFNNQGARSASRTVNSVANTACASPGNTACASPGKYCVIKPWLYRQLTEENKGGVAHV